MLSACIRGRFAAGILNITSDFLNFFTADQFAETFDAFADSTPNSTA